MSTPPSPADLTADSATATNSRATHAEPHLPPAISTSAANSATDATATAVSPSSQQASKPSLRSPTAEEEAASLALHYDRFQQYMAAMELEASEHAAEQQADRGNAHEAVTTPATVTTASPTAANAAASDRPRVRFSQQTPPQHAPYSSSSPVPPSSATRPSARVQQASAHHAPPHCPPGPRHQFAAPMPAFHTSAAFADNGDALNMSEIRLRLLQEEADRIALEEQVFLLERSNRALSIETQTLRIHLHDMQLRAQSAEERVARRLPKAAAAGIDQQLTAALMELHRVSAERDDAQRRLAAMAKADDPDFLSSYLQLEDDHQRVVAEKGRLQDRVRELTEVESQLVEHKLHAAQMHERHDDLEFHVRHTVEPHIAMLERDLDQREQTIHYLHQMLADERAKNNTAPK